jgi:hypothetical protein
MIGRRDQSGRWINEPFVVVVDPDERTRAALRSAAAVGIELAQAMNGLYAAIAGWRSRICGWERTSM